MNMKLSNTLAVMLFFAFAAAVPKEMLKREVTCDPAFHKDRTHLHTYQALEAKGIVHCDLICEPVDCGYRAVTFRDCFGNACGCADA
ncbi:hypothetical protein GGX14DRAFT_698532 [Mycena pura]|uniref:Uncharacterized protein n=1 Tax=Mycena pura TaxID=153505 RepID=A0AAD6VC86_9AGAR|nr:hypothetical protein GGX14DRAFT_698532 [Mycena pura]